ncbi:MAG: hypothetical protein A2Z14_03585 [Chloroflexi bacterium RBG_16_48_8]|nr:MAG: hypothetical protein A2Z14_03585 [Chloroflexi bacterium RBG_16_48_8]
MPEPLDSVLRRVIALTCILVLMVSCKAGGSEPIATPTAPLTSTPSPSPTLAPTSTPEPSPTKLPDVQGEISLWVDWTEPELMVLFHHLEAFQERFPEIQISVSYFPSAELLDRFRAAVQEGMEPTMLIGPSDWTKQLVQDGSIRELDGRATEEFLGSIQPVALEGVAFNQSIYGLPLSMEGILLYRNRSLISESPASLDDLVSLTQELEGEDLIGIRLDLGFLQTGAFLQACGGELLGVDGELALTLRAGECWLDILQKLRLAGPVTLNTEDDLEAFEAGQAAWLVDGSWNSARIMEALGMEQVAIDPWPIYSPTENTLTGYAWSRNIFFGAAAEEQDFNAAWILARYLLTPEVQEDFARSTLGQHVPVLKSVPTTERWLQEMMTAMGMNIALPLYPEFSIFTEHLELAAVDVARRGYDPYFVIRWVYFNIEKDLRFAASGGD